MLNLENKEYLLEIEYPTKETNTYITESVQISHNAKYFAYKNRTQVEFLKFFVV